MTIRRTAPSKDTTAVAVAWFIERRRSAADAAHAASGVVAVTTADGVVVTVAGPAPAPVATTTTATADAVAARIRATRMRMAQEREIASQR
jgi:hypothetical protein